MGLRDMYIRHFEKKWEQKSPEERAAYEAKVAEWERSRAEHRARLDSFTGFVNRDVRDFSLSVDLGLPTTVVASLSTPTSLQPDHSPGTGNQYPDDNPRRGDPPPAMSPRPIDHYLLRAETWGAGARRDERRFRERRRVLSRPSYS